MNLREEADRDFADIADLITRAFAQAPHRSGTEAAIVAALRDSGALHLSLVAEAGGILIGHIAFSPVAISSGARGWYGLGPISVAPEHQGRGVGAALIRAGLSRLSAQGAAGLVLLGDPAFYARFGFVADPRLKLPGVPAQYFQSRLLLGPMAEGEVRYAAAFGV